VAGNRHCLPPTTRVCGVIFERHRCQRAVSWTTHGYRLIGTNSGAVSVLHQPVDARCNSRPSFECLSLCVWLAQREFGLLGRDCRTTKMRQRDWRAVIASNAARIRLCVKIVIARLAQSPGTSGRICKAEKSKTRDRSDTQFVAERVGFEPRICLAVPI
jgi:hypothetical protein